MPPGSLEARADQIIGAILTMQAAANAAGGTPPAEYQQVAFEIYRELGLNRLGALVLHGLAGIFLGLEEQVCIDHDRAPGSLLAGYLVELAANPSRPQP